MIGSRILSDSNIHDVHEQAHITDLPQPEFLQYSTNAHARFISGSMTPRKMFKGDNSIFEEATDDFSQLLGLKSIVREYKSLFKTWRK